MGIPEAQLETWSHQGAIAGSSSTYATVKNVLESAATPYAGKSYKVFLQGSYGTTRIFGQRVMWTSSSGWIPAFTAISPS